MAQVPSTSNIYEGDGATRVFALTFPYLKPVEVFVTVDGVVVPYTWLAGSTASVELLTPPALGTVVRVYRDTLAFVPLHQFNGGVPFLPRYVDENNRQLLYSTQEAINATAGTAAEALIVAEEAKEIAQAAEDKVDAAVIDSAAQLRMDLAANGGGALVDGVGSRNTFAWGNVPKNERDYAERGPNIGPDMATIARVGFDSAGTHGAGTIATMTGPAQGTDSFGYYLVELVIKTTAKGHVNVLLDGRSLIGDHPLGYPFAVGGVTLQGIENNRAIDDVTYTFMYETSGQTFSELQVKTDEFWAGRIDSVKLYKVDPSKFIVGGMATGNGLRNPMGLKVGGYARNDIAVGDKFSLGAQRPDDGQPKTPAHNLAVGAKALASCQDGDQNTAVGTYALQFHQTSNCTAVGYSALKMNTKGRENTSTGYKSLTSCTIGSRNTADGFWAMGQLTDGDFNTATGWYAGRNLLSGSSNTYNGARAGFSNPGGSGNTYLGAHAGYGSGSTSVAYDNVTCGGAESWAYGVGTTAYGVQARVGTLAVPSPEGTALGHLATASGDYGPTAVGYKALASGSRSTAVGEEAKAEGVQTVALGALAQAGGSYTTAVGGQAGLGCTGTRNTFVGPGAGAAANSYSNTTAVGSFAQVTGNNQVQLGDAATTTYVYGTVQNRSDLRDKADVETTTLGLDWIMGLKPIQGRWDMREDYTERNDDGTTTWYPRDGRMKRNRLHQWFGAQDVAALCKEKGVDFGGLQDHNILDGEDVLSLGYDEFIPPIVKAMQEQNARLDAQDDRLKAIESMLKQLLNKE